MHKTNTKREFGILIEIPEQLKKEGEFRFILIKTKEKIPIEKNWQQLNNYAWDDPKLQEHLQKGGNYGVLCGKGNLIVIDFDDKKTQEELEPKLPTTFTVKASKLHHKYFFIDEMLEKKIPIKNEKKETIMDIQATGSQVIGAGSKHPNGQTYIIVDPSDIASIKKKDLFALLDPYQKKDDEEIIIKKTLKGDKDNVLKLIKQKIPLSQIMGEIGFDITRSPTECIWHGSKGKANFSWSDTKGLYHCFNCGAKGDVIKLYMIWYDCNFLTAKKELAERIGIKIKTEKIVGGLKLDNYQDNVERFYELQPFFYDKSGMFWFWNKEEYKWEIVDDIDVMNSIEKELSFGGQTVTSSIKNGYLEAFKRVGRNKIPEDAPKEWVQFKDQIFNIETKETFEATPLHFICNPIPWKIGETEETPKIDKLITEWVGSENKETLYEIIAYCCYADYPIHLIFCLTGTGRNGKTSFQKLLTNFIGIENISSTELDTLLDSRFESTKLYKKLICTLGETNFGVLNKTSLLKKLCGQDLIGYEFKQKRPFDDYNYAKIIINSNSLPTSEDTSDGFYRRWLILDFPNEFDEGKDIIDIIPKEEYDNLAKKITNILPGLIDLGVFTNQGSIDDRKNRYIVASNPLGLFIDNFCDKDVNDFVRYSELYTNYLQFLNKIKKRQVSHKEFTQALINAGYERTKTSKKIGMEYVNGHFVLGIKMKRSFVPEVLNMTMFSLNSLYKKLSEKVITTSTGVTKK